MATWFLRHGECTANAASIFAGQGVDPRVTTPEKIGPVAQPRRCRL